jgi:hypothetical protein
MMTYPAGDWSVFKQLFADHWDEFHRAHPRYQTSYYAGLMAKMLACGNPERWAMSSTAACTVDRARIWCR